MPLRPSKIVYLFGAGATHGELVNLGPKKGNDAAFLEKNGLLMHQVSRRVCESAKEDGVFSPNIAELLSPAGLSNVELFISLLENNEIKSERAITALKRLIRTDILTRLSQSRLKRFHLHRALFELHSLTGSEERLSGIISLNFDYVADQAYKDIFNETPRYCLNSMDPPGVPFLKLHGGFNLTYRNRQLPIMTPGINKNYLELPYNFIWGRALETLIECDILRVIGCSLSQNDTGLVDLLFKAHLAKKDSFEIQLIDFDPKNNSVQAHYGFLPGIKRALEIEAPLIGDASIQDPSTGSNPFAIWLKAKIEKMLAPDEIKQTKYVKKVLE